MLYAVPLVTVRVFVEFESDMFGEPDAFVLVTVPEVLAFAIARIVLILVPMFICIPFYAILCHLLAESSSHVPLQDAFGLNDVSEVS